MVQQIKNLPAMQETQVQSLGQEGHMKGMETPSTILAWKIPWTEEPGGLQSKGSQRVRHNQAHRPSTIFISRSSIPSWEVATSFLIRKVIGLLKYPVPQLYCICMCVCVCVCVCWRRMGSSGPESEPLGISPLLSAVTLRGSCIQLLSLRITWCWWVQWGPWPVKKKKKKTVLVQLAGTEG